jgi:hypothetical protein
MGPHARSRFVSNHVVILRSPRPDRPGDLGWTRDVASNLLEPRHDADRGRVVQCRGDRRLRHTPDTPVTRGVLLLTHDLRVLAVVDDVVVVDADPPIG